MKNGVFYNSYNNSICLFPFPDDMVVISEHKLNPYLRKKIMQCNFNLCYAECIQYVHCVPIQYVFQTVNQLYSFKLLINCRCSMSAVVAIE